MSDLVDVAVVREFCRLLHERAAVALADVPNAGAIQLCRMLPSDERLLTCRHNVGDWEGMAKAAVDYATAGYNVYVEGRTVPADCARRGTAVVTRAVFAFVVERDADTGKAGRPLSGAPSLVVETSLGNTHEWLFVDRALSGTEAKQIGDAIRAAVGADSGTGVVTQPFRVAGTPNFPNAKKRARGRVACRPASSRLARPGRTPSCGRRSRPCRRRRHRHLRAPASARLARAWRPRSRARPRYAWIVQNNSRPRYGGGRDRHGARRP
jgi:hypothetical protein